MADTERDTNVVENDGDPHSASDKENLKESFTLEVLQVVKEAQLQHGLRHGDFQRYRQYCARRMRRIRKVLHFPQGTKHKVQPKKITPELLKDSRCLYLPLVDAERAWAFAMQLKSEANTEPRKKFHMISRLRKAVKHADELKMLSEGGRYDARTKLEVQAYSSWMRGLLDFESEDWSLAMENFSEAKMIYEKLSETVSDESKETYLQRCQEISPNIRYCEYNIGDKSAADDLIRMRMEVGREDPMTSRLDELIEKTRERQSVTLSEVVWLSRSIPVKNEQVRLLLLSIQQNAKQLSEAASGELKLSLYESILKELIEAQQSVKEELKDDPIFRAAIRGQPVEGKVSNAIYLHTYLAYLRQVNTMERNLLMVESLKTGKLEDGKKNRPQDFARLYDVIIQNLTEILHLPGLEDQLVLAQEINVQIIGYKAFRCFYAAQTFLSVKKWRETIALYERSLEYTRESIVGYERSKLDEAKKEKDVAALENLMKDVEGLKYSVHASSILDTQDLNDRTKTTSTKPLIERLDDYLEDASVATKRPNLIQSPPDFEPIPVKPVFFDLALNHVQFPSLDDKMEQQQRQKTGGLLGWFWGSKK